MKILTKKNGIAFVAVLTLLLILTLLIPAMFSMSETATKSAMRGQKEQRASYLARTSCEMAVSAFQTFYDAYDEAVEIVEGSRNEEQKKVVADFQTFITNKSLNVSRIYMYLKDGVNNENIPDYDPKSVDWQTYEKNAVIYRTANTTVPGYTLYGYADCEVTYEEVSDYYRIELDGSMTKLKDEPLIDENGNVVIIDGQIQYDPENTALKQYETLRKNVVEAISLGSETLVPSCHKVDRKEIRFNAVSTIDDKKYTDFSRGCLMILPTKPAEEKWIVPTEVNSNQIFAVTSKATGVMQLDYSDEFKGEGNGGEGATGQAVYSFSCTGNMVISSEGLTVPEGSPYQITDFTLGVYPVTTTKDPENDPTFACIATNNMRSWASGAQKDNFIMFSATNGIQVEMPVNLLINPCRTGRIGDGFARNQSLYKILAFQSPNIVFKEKVISFISLWKNTSIIEAGADLFGDGYDARRITSLILSAPESTPYSYHNEDRGEVVKAGKVYFTEDAYIWFVPFSENGSSYKTQTVYYRDTDIRQYKIASAGDVYYFNAEVPVSGSTAETTGFSMSAYFMEVLYSDLIGADDSLNFWTELKEAGFGFVQNNLVPKVGYVKDDFHKIGNIYDGDGGRMPLIDDFYIVWDS